MQQAGASPDAIVARLFAHIGKSADSDSDAGVDCGQLRQFGRCIEGENAKIALKKGACIAP